MAYTSDERLFVKDLIKENPNISDDEIFDQVSLLREEIGTNKEDVSVEKETSALKGILPFGSKPGDEFLEKTSDIGKKAIERFKEEREMGSELERRGIEEQKSGDIIGGSIDILGGGVQKTAGAAAGAAEEILEPIFNSGSEAISKFFQTDIGKKAIESEKKILSQQFPILSKIAPQLVDEATKILESPESKSIIESVKKAEEEVPGVRGVKEIATGLIEIGTPEAAFTKISKPARESMQIAAKEFSKEVAEKAAEITTRKIDDLAQQIFQPSPAIAARDPRLLEGIKGTARLLKEADSFKSLNDQLKKSKNAIGKEIGSLIEENKDNIVSKNEILQPLEDRILKLADDAQTEKQAERMMEIWMREKRNLAKFEESINIADAQKRKVQLNDLLGNFFKKTEDQMTDLELAELQALNEIRRGYMKSIATSIPEIAGLNEQFGSLSVTIPLAERMAIRSGNVLKPRGVSGFIQKIPGVNLVRRILKGQVPVDEALFSRAASVEDELRSLTKELELLAEKETATKLVK